MKVLVVEDSEAQRLSIKMILKMRGFDVVTAEDGEAGWLEFLQGEFDAVLTDFEMPRLDGLELIARIKEHGSEVPVILYSATCGLMIPDGVVHLDKNDITISFDVIAQRLRELIAG